jgi:hypothetical protein
MSEKSIPSKQEDVIESFVAPADQTLDHALDRLPTQYREEILKQYDLPQTKVSFLTVFRYATPLEYAMQVIGLIAAIGAGTLRKSQGS